MASASVKFEISMEDVQCATCLDCWVDKDPRILSCQHIFCFDCISKFPKNFDQICCPLCKQKMQVPQGGVKYLKKPLIAASLKKVDSINNIKHGSLNNQRIMKEREKLSNQMNRIFDFEIMTESDLISENLDAYFAFQTPNTFLSDIEYFVYDFNKKKNWDDVIKFAENHREIKSFRMNGIFQPCECHFDKLLQNLSLSFTNLKELYFIDCFFEVNHHQLIKKRLMKCKESKCFFLRTKKLTAIKSPIRLFQNTRETKDYCITEVFFQLGRILFLFTLLLYYIFVDILELYKSSFKNIYHLKKLNLSERDLTLTDCISFGKKIQEFDRVEAIYLSKNPNMEKGVLNIFSSLFKSSKSLRIIDLSYCDLSLHQINGLKDFLSNCSRLEEFNVCGNKNIGIKIIEICKELRKLKNCLKILDLSECNINSQGVEEVCFLFEFYVNPEKVFLHGNNFGERDINLLYDKLKNLNSLTEFNF